ncbi:MAG TPA: RecX family transcriptional regulator [Solirubrobacteraceae bacterium]|nr:RecX family transcriptional regulator [Solirubrobacteraceae bacterium]
MSLGTDEQLQRALELGYAYVNRRDRTVSEVRLQLERKGISPEQTEAAIQTLSEQALLDDARFAHLFVTDKRELEQWGNERIMRGLLARGIDRHLAATALGGEATDESGQDGGEDGELQRALALLRRRFPQPPQDRRERERALGVLLRKGYESELALDALAAHARGD